MKSATNTEQELLRLLEPVYGYCHLGLEKEAHNELKLVPNNLVEHPMVQTALIHVLMSEKKWSIAYETASALCLKYPDYPESFIHAAYCLHEQGKTSEAKQTLASSPDALKNTALFHYNMACYDCQLGNIPQARKSLVHAFHLDSNFIEESQSDRDLTPLRDFIKEHLRHTPYTQEPHQN